MSQHHLALSLFLVWYLVALFVAAVPKPASLSQVGTVRYPSGDPLSAFLTPRLDTFARAFAPVPSALWEGSSAIRPFTGGLMTRVGLGQRWDMFADPNHHDDYLRLDYFVRSDAAARAGPSWMASELVLPIESDAFVRASGALRNHVVNRTILTALNESHSSIGSADNPLRPIVNYFSRRFESRALGAGERIVRIEAWHGLAENPAPYSTSSAEAARHDILRDYYQGIQGPVIDTTYAALQSARTEGDIVWALEYIEER